MGTEYSRASLYLLLLAIFACTLSYSATDATSTKITGAKWNLSEEDYLRIDTQLKLLNKPAIKTVKTEDGDLYGCVDFFKQPAFDHPLLKNYTSNMQVLPPTVRNQSPADELQRVDCPFGTVPIRRVTKDELIMQHLAMKKLSSDKRPRYAMIKSKDSQRRYSGLGAYLSVHNPRVEGDQYSLARIRLYKGTEFIEAGWTVFPQLYKDTKTRLFIYTAGRSDTYCYNTGCPGFVHVAHNIPLDSILTKISVPGGPRYLLRVFINQDTEGNWKLHVGNGATLIGYWPDHIFTGQESLASSLEWGGEASAPPGVPFPPMGAGEAHLREDSYYDAYLKRITAYDEEGRANDADDVVRYISNKKLYDIIDIGFWKKDDFRHLAFYGGSGGMET